MVNNWRNGNIKNSIYYFYQCYFGIRHLCLVYLCFFYMVDSKNFYQHMLVYYSLLLPQHNLDSIMFMIQLLVF
jgi:hypothetical protein